MGRGAKGLEIRETGTLQDATGFHEPGAVVRLKHGTGQRAAVGDNAA